MEFVDVSESITPVVNLANVAKKFVDVALVDVELTMSRLLMVDVALLTSKEDVVADIPAAGWVKGSSPVVGHEERQSVEIQSSVADKAVVDA